MNNTKLIGLGDRMKQYEKVTELKIQNDRPLIVRLDGKCFSKFTKGLKKPFDNNLSKVFIKVCEDLLQQYNPEFIFHQSDEISLVFFQHQSTSKKIKDTSQNNEGWCYLHGGRVQKISSIMAGFVSARFNYWLCSSGFPNSNYSQSTLDRMYSGRAYFDARVFNVSNEMEVYNYIYWRSIHDCQRNSISNLARQYFSSKQIHRKNTITQKKMLLDKGIDWNKFPESFKYGIFLKKSKYILNEKTENECIRTKPKIFYLNLSKEKEIDAVLQLFKSKYFK